MVRAALLDALVIDYTRSQYDEEDVVSIQRGLMSDPQEDYRAFPEILPGRRGHFGCCSLRRPRMSPSGEHGSSALINRGDRAVKLTAVSIVGVVLAGT